MDMLNAMRTFQQVALSGGFTSAAKQQGRAVSSVSRQVSLLEEELGKQLVIRTTRAIKLTTSGTVFLEHVQRILKDLDEAISVTSGEEEEPSGVLRVSAPSGVASELIALSVPQFLKQYPKIQIVLNVTDRQQALVEEDIDIAIRMGEQKDSSMIAALIGRSRRRVCASPDYLRKHGMPDHPSQLTDHACLTWRDQPGKNKWEFVSEEGETSVEVSGPLFARNTEALIDAAVAGLGIIHLPDWNFGAEIRDGRLVTILDAFDAVPMTTPVYAVYPAALYQPPKLKAFVTFLRSTFLEKS